MEFAVDERSKMRKGARIALAPSGEDLGDVGAVGKGHQAKGERGERNFEQFRCDFAQL
jgi:hypothetical protein